MLHPVLAKLASEPGFSATEHSIFGRVQGVVVAFNQSEIRNNQYSVVINLLHLPESERRPLKDRLLKPKPKGMENSRLDSNTGCLVIALRRPLLGGEDAYQLVCNSLLERITTTVPASPEGQLELFNGYPLLDSQVDEVKRAVLKNRRPPSLRFLTALVTGMGLTAIANLITYFVPGINRFTGGPLSFFLIGFFTLGCFFKGGEGSEISILAEATLFVVTLGCVLLFQILGLGVALIPAEFRRSPELIQLVLEKWHSEFGIHLYFFITIVLFSGIGLAFRQRKGMLATPRIGLDQIVLDKSRSYSKGSKKLLIFFFGSMLFALINIFAGITVHRPEGDVDTVWPILGVVFLCHIIFFGCVLAWIFKDKDLLTALTRTNKQKASSAAVPLAFILPIFLTAGMVIWAFVVNDIFDRSTPEIRYGRIAFHRDPKVTLARCWPLNELKTGIPLNNLVCERDTGPLHGGEVLQYLYRVGWLRTGVHYKNQVQRPETWEKLIVALGTPSKVRSFDIEYLLKQPEEQKKITGEFLAEWKRRCEQGKGEFCRISAYTLDEKKQAEERLSLLRKGCQFGDYKSCYGILLVKSGEKMVDDQHAALSLAACKFGELEACDEYGFYWKDNGEPQHRANIVQVMDQLCKSGDTAACEKLLWEKNRI